MPYRAGDKTLLGEEFDSLAVYPFAPRLHPHPIPVEDICDEPLVCISMNAAWAGHVLGLLEVLNQDDAWVGTPDDIYLARQKVLRLMTMFSFPCDDGTTVTTTINNQSTILQQTIYNSYNGTLESIDPDVPETNFDSDPDDITPEDIAARHDALCYAVRGIVEVFCAQVLAAYGESDALLALGGTLLSVTGPIGVFFAFTLNFINFLESQPAKDACRNNAAKENVTCCLLDALEGVGNTFQNYSAMPTSCYTVDDGSPEFLICQMMRQSGFATLENYVVFNRILGQGFRYAKAEILEPCSCNEWAHTFMSIGNPRLSYDTITQGSYDATNNWYLGEYQALQVRMACEVHTLAPQPWILTRVTCTFRTVVNDPFSGRNATIYLFDGVAAGEILAQISTTVSGTYTLDSGEINETTLGLIFELFSRSSGDPADALELRSITIEGRGYDPFA